MNIFREVADVQTADMLDLDVPALRGGKPIIVESEPDWYVKQVMEDFVVRAERIRGGGVDPSVDNFLKITHEARLLGTDARLIDKDAPNNPDGKLNKVGVEGYEDIISPGGQCLPGIQRFFVTADGKFFPCERVDETSEELCIGDLQQGINIDNAIKILNVADVTSRQCIECWCYKMCYQCISKAQEDGRINAEARLKWCQQTRAGVEGTIKDYIILKKYGCKFEEA